MGCSLFGKTERRNGPCLSRASLRFCLPTSRTHLKTTNKRIHVKTLGKWFNDVYNRNELYSYSKFNIYKKLQQTNASTQNLPFHPDLL